MEGRSFPQQIIALEQQTWEALKTSGKGLLPFISQDCCMLLPGGVIFDNQSEPNLIDILSREDFKPWTEFEMDGIRVLPLGQGAAAICYEVRASRGKEEYNSIVSSVWRLNESGIWQLVMHQQSPAAV